MLKNFLCLNFCSVSLQRSQDHSNIPLLTLRAIQIMLFNIFLDKIGYQVVNALAPSKGLPDLRGGDVFGDPFFHQVNVVLVFPWHIRFVDELLSIIPSPSNTYEPIVSQDFGDILSLP